MRFLSLCLLSLLLPAAGCEQPSPPEGPWRVIHRGSQVVVSVDTAQVEFADHGAKVWLRFDQTPEPVPGQPGRSSVRVDMMDRIDCDGGMVNNLWMRQWDAEGAMISDEAATGRWRPIGGHPFGETIYPALCEWLAGRQPRRA